jgi:prolyl-tRNA synthetase
MSAKFKKHELIGIPFQIIIGSKSEENRFEFKEVGKDSTLLNLDEIKEKIIN